jgi:hypothetical protein
MTGGGGGAGKGDMDYLYFWPKYRSEGVGNTLTKEDRKQFFE